MAGLTRGARPLRWLYVLGLACLGSSQFHYISDERMTYAEAKTYCRSKYTDLATVRNSIEMETILTLSNEGRVWIGLELGSSQTWHWSEVRDEVDYFNWRAGEPGNSNQDRCAAMDTQGGWFESDCTTRRSFVCQAGVSLQLVETQKSWRDAQTHCRNELSELVTIHSALENQAVQNITKNQIVWTGLFQDAWTWSDGSSSAFRFWKPQQPNYLTGQECTVTVLRNDGRWNDLRCELNLNFICAGPSKDAPTTTQPTTPTKKRPTTDVTRLHETTVAHLTTAPAQHQSTNHHLTPQGTTAAMTQPITKAKTVAPTRPTPLNNATTVAQTQPASFNNATTNAETVALTRPTSLHNATTTAETIAQTQLTTINSSSSHALTRPTALLFSTTKPSDNNATHPSTAPVTTLMKTSQNITSGWTSHTSSQHSSTDQYILIQKNLTWIEALSYCRDHHGDLADITSSSAQDQAAQTSRKATTAHVWLGLRYTCNFSFWFWTNSASLCYHNWGPGHGSEANYGCGVTGAMEATGRQQWVALSQSRKLNFICRVCQ